MSEAEDLFLGIPARRSQPEARVTGTYPAERNRDSLDYCADLNWYFGCVESMLGLKSHMGHMLSNLADGTGGLGHNDVSPLDVKQSDRAKLRHVFARFRLLETRHQVSLQRHYEGREVPETHVAAAHKAYYATVTK